MPHQANFCWIKLNNFHVFFVLSLKSLNLGNSETLHPKYRDHPLMGEWKSCRDCHIEPDWVLIYYSDSNTLRLERTGSHSDLFN